VIKERPNWRMVSLFVSAACAVIGWPIFSELPIMTVWPDLGNRAAMFKASIWITVCMARCGYIHSYCTWLCNDFSQVIIKEWRVLYIAIVFMRWNHLSWVTLLVLRTEKIVWKFTNGDGQKENQKGVDGSTQEAKASTIVSHTRKQSGELGDEQVDFGRTRTSVH